MTYYLLIYYIPIINKNDYLLLAYLFGLLVIVFKKKVIRKPIINKQSIILCLIACIFPVINLILCEMKFVTVHQILLFVTSAVVEELLFRRVLLEKLLSKYNQIVSLVVTNVAFSLVHLLNLTSEPISYILIQIFLAFTYGVLLSVIYTKTNSIILPLLLHILINILSIGIVLPDFTLLYLLLVVFYLVVDIFILIKEKHEIIH